MEESIADITSQHLIGHSENIGAASLDDLLIDDPGIKSLIKQIAVLAEWRFHQPKDFVEQELWLKLWTSKPPNLKSLKAWLSEIAKNYCLNQINRKNTEIAFLDKLTSQAQESTRRGGKPMVQSSPVSTPEQELSQREQEKEEDNLQNERKAWLRKVIEPFPEWLTEPWIMGKTAKEISEESGRPLSTIYRMLKKMQQTITEEVGHRGIR